MEDESTKLSPEELRLAILSVLAQGCCLPSLIRDRIIERSDGRVAPSPTALRSALRYLEERGYVTGHWDIAERSVAQKAYSLTRSGEVECALRQLDWWYRQQTLEEIFDSEAYAAH